MAETDLYPPVKRLLEAQGYVVKAEIGRCDVVALRGEEPPLIVELKSGLTLKLLLQAIDRQTMSDAVYLAVPASALRRDRAATKLLRRLGLGLILVSGSRAEAEFDPAPYQPRRNARRAALLLKEFAHRMGDPNLGGSTRRPQMTAYRQDALRCADLLARDGATRIADIRKRAGVERAANILRDDVYGWFCRKARGVYGLTDKGLGALETFAPALVALRGAEAACPTVLSAPSLTLPPWHGAAVPAP